MPVSQRLLGAPGDENGIDTATIRDALARRWGRKGTGVLREVGRIARRRGSSAALVGGVVRDLLLGRECRDIDVVVGEDAPAFAKELALKLSGRCRGNPRFGTARWTRDDGFEIEFATARRENYPEPGALPRVESGSLSDDARRRDFAINTLRIRLEPRAFGRLEDELGGVRDLRRKSIRVLHDRSFVDDPTRAYRAARLSARLGFRVEPGTARRIGEAIRAGWFDRLSPARLRHEIERTLDENEIPAAVAALGRLGLLSTLDRALRYDGARTRAPLARVGEAVELGLAPPKTGRRRWVVALGVLVHLAGRGAGRRVVRRLEPDRAAERSIVESGAAVADLIRRIDRSKDLRPSRIRAACDRVSSDAIRVAMSVSTSPAVRRNLERYLTHWATERPDVRGDDLLAAGIRPGPAVATGIRAALRAKLDRAAGRPEQLRAAIRAAGRT